MGKLLLLTTLACIFYFASGNNGTEGGGGSQYDVCGRYCDRSGRWYDRQQCIASRPYCCQDGDSRSYVRYCCSEHRLRRSAPDRDWSYCPWTSWWAVQWRVIVGMLVSLIVMLCCVGCCYYCCAGDGFSGFGSSRRPRRCRRGNPAINTGETEAGTVSYSVDNDLPRNTSRVFDPQSPHAFQPPAYDSLPKEPPKYAEIFRGQDNAAFTGSAEAASGAATSAELPPQYSESAAEQGRTPSSGTPPEPAARHSPSTPGDASGASATDDSVGPSSGTREGTNASATAAGGSRAPQAAATNTQDVNVQHGKQSLSGDPSRRQATLAPVNT